MRNGNFLKMGVSEICIKQIRDNQGLGVVVVLLYAMQNARDAIMASAD